MDPYLVKKISALKPAISEVPASKSILNRALLLSSLAGKRVHLKCGALCEDTEAMANCLRSIGVSIENAEDGLFVCGNSLGFGGVIDVKSAGTVARFLPALAAFRRAKCSFVSSEQMAKRPMSILKTLEEHGARFHFEGAPYSFPFSMDASGFHAEEISVDTAESTQYASAILLAACAAEHPTRVELRGPRAHGSYLAITRETVRAFGAKIEEKNRILTVTPPSVFPDEYAVEPDLSGACYLFALALLFKTKITVRGLTTRSVQGDRKFLGLLEGKGVRIFDTPQGLCADGTFVPIFNGIDVDMNDFSDQAFTVAALALFASTPSILRGLGHTRAQESDRIRNIVENINALGARAFAVDGDIFIEPEKIAGGTVKTYGDHRSAMGFALVGLKTGNVYIDDPKCCEKTFPRYFELIESLAK